MTGERGSAAGVAAIPPPPRNRPRTLMTNVGASLRGCTRLKGEARGRSIGAAIGADITAKARSDTNRSCRGRRICRVAPGYRARCKPLVEILLVHAVGRPISEMAYANPVRGIVQAYLVRAGGALIPEHLVLAGMNDGVGGEYGE